MDKQTERMIEERAYSVVRGAYGDPAWGSWPAEAREWKRELIERYTREEAEREEKQRNAA